MPERRVGLVPLMFLFGCAGKDLSLFDPDTGDTGGRGETGETGDTSGDASAEDEALLYEAIAGDRDAAETLARVASSGGLPVETADGTFLFACLCGDGAWYLAGDHDGWAGAEMERAGELSWIEVEIDDPDGSLYKFTDLDTWMADPRGRRYGYDEYGEHSLVRASAAHLERWYDVEGMGLLPRDLQVWVPDDGALTHALYAHDGQNLFDPEAFWGGWQLQDSVPDRMLVVGIDNTVDRMDEYTHTADRIYGENYGGKGDEYAALVDELIRPMMEDAYGGADVVGTMGSSLGGLISLYIADQYPDRYDMALSLSGTLGWGSIGADNPTIIEIYQDAGHRGTAIYIDSGGGGTCEDSDGDGIYDDGADAADNYCENLQMADTLESAGYEYEVDLWHWWEPDAEHNEAEWAWRVWRPLELFASL